MIGMKVCDENILRAILEILFLANIEQNETVYEDAGVFGIPGRGTFNVSSRPKNRYEHKAATDRADIVPAS